MYPSRETRDSSFSKSVTPAEKHSRNLRITPSKIRHSTQPAVRQKRLNFAEGEDSPEAPSTSAPKLIHVHCLQARGQFHTVEQRDLTGGQHRCKPRGEHVEGESQTDFVQELT